VPIFLVIINANPMSGWAPPLLVSLSVIFSITLLGWGFHHRENDCIKVPKSWPARSGYFTLLDGKLCGAASGKWSLSQMENLIYLFDNMAIETSYLDETGVRHELNFRVKFDRNADITFTDFLAFYKWYYDLFAAMPNTAAVLEHIKQQSSPDVPHRHFHIQFPLNPSIPPVNGD
jgi:hypothetical protein